MGKHHTIIASERWPSFVAFESRQAAWSAAIGWRDLNVEAGARISGERNRPPVRGPGRVAFDGDRPLHQRLSAAAVRSGCPDAVEKREGEPPAIRGPRGILCAS